MSSSEAARLHGLLMDLVRTGGLLQPEHSATGQVISLSQAFALHELDTDTPLAQRDLVERLRLEKSTVSRLVTDLERQGLLERDKDPASRRQYRLRITDRGRAIHQEMAATFQRRYEQWVAAMTPDELAALLTGLPALVRVIHDS